MKGFRRTQDGERDWPSWRLSPYHCAGCSATAISYWNSPGLRRISGLWVHSHFTHSTSLLWASKTCTGIIHLFWRCPKGVSEEETHRYQILRYPGKAEWRHSQECMSQRGRETDVRTLTLMTPLPWASQGSTLWNCSACPSHPQDGEAVGINAS